LLNGITQERTSRARRTAHQHSRDRGAISALVYEKEKLT
jgi:hypothetical protein